MKIEYMPNVYVFISLQTLFFPIGLHTNALKGRNFL